MAVSIIQTEEAKQTLLKMLADEKRWIEWVIVQIKTGNIEEDLVEWHVKLRECNERVEHILNLQVPDNQ
jgi:hypothetical protein